jgi:hypothetical protein
MGGGFEQSECERARAVDCSTLWQPRGRRAGALAPAHSPRMMLGKGGLSPALHLAAKAGAHPRPSLGLGPFDLRGARALLAPCVCSAPVRSWRALMAPCVRCWRLACAVGALRVLCTSLLWMPCARRVEMGTVPGTPSTSSLCRWIGI